MNIVNKKFEEFYRYLFISVVLTVALPLFLKKTVYCIIGLLFLALIGYKCYELYKAKKNNMIYTIDVLCTNSKRDYLNFLNARYYEFEPLKREDYTEMINLKIFEDEMSLMRLFKAKKNANIKVDYGYTLAFICDKNGEKQPDDKHFIGYERYVLPE